MLMLLDLSAAFDTVNHGTLLRRQEKSYGLRGRVLRWSSSYINGRTQSVQRGPGRSAALFLTCGEPQGPVLVPILFLLYTADLIPLIERHALLLYLYADDTQIPRVLQPFAHRHSSGGDVRLHRRGVTVDAKQPTAAKHDQDRHPLLRHQPTTASDTADTNTGRLRLRYDSQISAGPRHLPGCGCLHDYTRHQVCIKLRSSLAPEPCYTAISHKTCLAVADRLFGPVTTGLWQRYVSRFPSYMFDKLQFALNAAARLIYSKRRFESVTPILHDLHWLRVPQRVEYNLSVLVYRCLHNLASEYMYLCDELRRVADISSRQRLRSSSTSALIVPPTRLSNVSDRTFPTAASRIWNSLPLHVTSAPSLQTFEKRLKPFLFSRSFLS